MELFSRTPAKNFPKLNRKTQNVIHNFKTKKLSTNRQKSVVPACDQYVQITKKIQGSDPR